MQQYIYKFYTTFDDVLLVSAKPSVAWFKNKYNINIQIYHLSGVVGSIDGDPTTAGMHNNEIHEIYFRPIWGETNRRRRRATLQCNNNMHSSRSNRTEFYIFCSLNERAAHSNIIITILYIYYTAPIRVTAAALVRSKLETVPI